MPVEKPTIETRQTKNIVKNVENLSKEQKQKEITDEKQVEIPSKETKQTDTIVEDVEKLQGPLRPHLTEAMEQRTFSFMLLPHVCSQTIH